MKNKIVNFFSHFQASSPACTELETVVMNWLGKMIGLPEEFLHSRVNSTGGGAIQVSTKN
jgi:histidine decarboxylase